MDNQYSWNVNSIRAGAYGHVIYELCCPVCKHCETVVSGQPDRCYTCGIALKFPKEVT